MLDVWQQETGGSGVPAGRRRGNLLDARQSLPAADRSGRAGNAGRQRRLRARRAPKSIVSSGACRIPDLVMYVFPHLAGTDPVPVPGYSTVFPLYQRVQYAMPGERVEDY